MITITNVTKRFGRETAVDNASLTIARGDSVALWGANGAGKSTLIRCLLGLVRFRGAISVDGHDVRRNGKRARLRIGYVPQEVGFYDDLRVEEAVRFFASLKGLGRVAPAEALEGVGLVGHGGKRVRELSGGMKQRLALAIALLGDPPVLALDEVTASLDAVGREDFIALLRGLSGAGRTMLFASHRIDEVAALARRVVVLERGRIASVEPCEAFIARVGGGAALHLAMAPGVREAAVRSLRSSGFAAQRNGVGLIVPIAPEHKAAPFRVLAEARIPIDDFEIVTVRHGAMQSDRREEGSQ